MSARTVTAALLALATGGCADPYQRPGREPSGPATVAAPAASPALQDMATAAERHAAALAARTPLLDHLPARVGAVHIDIAAALPDGRVALAVRHPAGQRRRARRAYESLLARHDDTGRDYQPRFTETR